MAMIETYLNQRLYDEAVDDMAHDIARQQGLDESSSDEETQKRRSKRKTKKPVHGAPVAQPAPTSGPPQMLRHKNHGKDAAKTKVDSWFGGLDIKKSFSVHQTAAQRSGASMGGMSVRANITRHSTARLTPGSAWDRIMGWVTTADRAVPIIHPRSRFRISWDIFIMVFVIFNAVMVPLDVSYGLPEDPALNNFNYAVDLLFFIDICLNFRTAYIDGQGHLVRDSDKIAINYCKFWFPIDLFATIPVDLFATAAGYGGSGAQLTVLQFLKTPRLLRLARLIRLMDRMKNANIFKVFNLIAMMMMFSHWLACIWYMMYRYSNWSDGPQDWAFDTLDNGSTMTYYISAYYQCFLLLVGNNQHPLNNAERAFFIITGIFGTCFYSAVVGQMAVLVANMNTVALRHRQKQDMTMDVLRYIGLPDKTKTRVQYYFDYITQYSHPSVEGLHFLTDLPKALYQEVTDFLYKDRLAAIPIFKGLEMAFLTSVSLRMRIVQYTPKEVIFRAGDLGQEMYIIRKGCVAVVGKCSQLMGVLTAGDHFGEIALLTQAKRTAKCVALSNCDLCVLNSYDLKVVMKDFPTSAKLLEETAAERLRQFQVAGRAGFVEEDETDEDDEEEEEHGGHKGDGAANSKGAGDGDGEEEEDQEEDEEEDASYAPLLPEGADSQGDEGAKAGAKGAPRLNKANSMRRSLLAGGVRGSKKERESAAGSAVTPGAAGPSPPAPLSRSHMIGAPTPTPAPAPEKPIPEAGILGMGLASREDSLDMKLAELSSFGQPSGQTLSQTSLLKPVPPSGPRASGLGLGPGPLGEGVEEITAAGPSTAAGPRPNSRGAVGPASTSGRAAPLQGAGYSAAASRALAEAREGGRKVSDPPSDDTAYGAAGESMTRGATAPTPPPPPSGPGRPPAGSLPPTASGRPSSVDTGRPGSLGASQELPGFPPGSAALQEEEEDDPTSMGQWIRAAAVRKKGGKNNRRQSVILSASMMPSMMGMGGLEGEGSKLGMVRRTSGAGITPQSGRTSENGSNANSNGVSPRMQRSPRMGRRSSIDMQRSPRMGRRSSIDEDQSPLGPHRSGRGAGPPEAASLPRYALQAGPSMRGATSSLARNASAAQAHAYGGAMGGMSPRSAEKDAQLHKDVCVKMHLLLKLLESMATKIENLETRLNNTDSQVARLEASHQMGRSGGVMGILDPMAAQSLQMASEASMAANAKSGGLTARNKSGLNDKTGRGSSNMPELGRQSQNNM